MTKETKYTCPMTLILPEGATDDTDSRILLLNDPKDARPRRYFFSPPKGLFDFTKIGVPSIDPRSILFAPNAVHNELPADQAAKTGEGSDIPSGYTSNKADIMVATPTDVLFHMLPMLQSSLVRSKRDTGKGLFLSLDDLFDGAEGAGRNKQLKYVISNEIYRPVLEKRLGSICDTVDAGDEKMFRLSEDKVVQVIVGKARRMVAQGLPSSMEEKFVARLLEVPVLSIKREESNVTFATQSSSIGVDDSQQPKTLDSQDSSVSSAPSTIVSDASSFTTVDTIAEDTAPSGVRELLRLRTAIYFLTASYTNTELTTLIEDKLKSEDSPINFVPLDDHLKHLASLRAEAAASRSFGDFSRKRSNMEDEDAVELRAEKKRKLEEEEKKKKAAMSRGVRDLKKVDVKGMKKMSDFFSKKPASTKANS